MVASNLKASINSLPSGSTKFGDLIFLLVSELITFKEYVAVCFHGYEDPTSPILQSRFSETPIGSAGKVLPTNIKTLKFNPDFCDSHLEIDDSATSVTCTTTTKWTAVLANRAMTSGFHSGDVVFDKCTTTCNIMVGVCEATQNLTYYVNI
jgi:hypothetical protein